MVCLTLQIFKGCLPHILLDQFLNTLSRILWVITYDLFQACEMTVKLKKRGKYWPYEVNV